MAQNLQLNPETKDYVVQDGKPIGSDRVEEAAYFALRIPEGRWLYGARGQGSLLHRLSNQKRTASIEQQFAAYATSAIERQLIATGKALSVAITSLDSNRTGTSQQISLVPNETQLSQQLNFISV